MRNLARKIIAVLMTLAILIPTMSFSFAAAPVERIDLNISAITIGVGQKVKTVKPVAYPEGSATVFTWESSDENIATVNAKGQIKGVKKGSATITISAGGVSAELEVNVVKKGKGVTKISLPKTASVVRGKSTTLKATLTPAKPKNKTIIWKSSDESVATVDSKGKVTGVSTGKATITAISSSGKTAKSTVTVKPVLVKKIKVTGKASMLRNEAQQLNVTIKPAGADNQELKWTSSNKKVATVDANGVVTAKKKGTVTITATAKDGSKAKGTFKITVKKGVFTPTPTPTPEPTPEPTAEPTAAPTATPTPVVTAAPTAKPTEKPTEKPTAAPTSGAPVITPNPEFDNIIVGTTEQKPFAYYNENGELVGIDVDVAKYICNKLGYNAEFAVVQQELVHVLVLSGEAKFGIAALTPDMIDTRYADYSAPYIGEYVIEVAKTEGAAASIGSDILSQVNTVITQMKSEGIMDAIEESYGGAPTPAPTATPSPAPTATPAPEYTPAEDFSYEVFYGEDTIILLYDYMGSDTEVIVPPYIEGYPVTDLTDGFLNNNTTVTKLVLPETVTAINWDSMQNATALTELVLPEGFRTIGYNSLMGCTSLKELKLPSTLKTLGENALSGMTGLSEITIPKGVKTINEGALCGNGADFVVKGYSSSVAETYCNEHGIIFESLTPADEMPNPASDFEYGEYDGNISIYKYIGEDTTVIIPDTIDGLPVYDILDNAFCDTNVVSVTLPATCAGVIFDTFKDCTTLTEINLNDGLEYISDGAFRGCTGLTSVRIPSSLTQIGGSVFEGCANLREINIPRSVEYLGENAFKGCTSLTELTIYPETSDIDGNPFDGCSENLVIKGYYGTAAETMCAINGIKFVALDQVDESVFTYTANEAGEVTITGYTGDAKDVVIPGTIGGKPVTAIGDEAFKGNDFINTLAMAASVTSVGANAFDGMTALENITLSANITTMGEMALANCVSLWKVDMPHALTEIPYGCIMGCTSLYEVTIDVNVSKIGEMAFDECSEMRNIFVHYENPYYADMDGVLYDISDEDAGMKLVRCPMGKGDEMWIPDGTTNVNAEAMAGCTKITALYMNDELTYFGSWALAGCDAITEVHIGAQFNVEYEDAYESIAGLYGLRTVTASEENSALAVSGNAVYTKDMKTLLFCPKGYTGSIVIDENTTTIGKIAFNDSKLTYVVVPENVVTIEEGAFDNCSTDLDIFGVPGSAIEEYCTLNGLNFYDVSNLN